MGRFMSPDWAAQVEPVPYAVLGDPQSLNLYAYVRNNPLSRVDADGHCANDDLRCQQNEEWAKTHYESSPTNPNPGNVMYEKGAHHKRSKPKGTPAQRRVAGIIYNETSTVRPTATSGPGSRTDLSNARTAIAQVLEINKSKERVASPTVHDNLRDRDAASGWGDSLDAAINAGNAPDGTNGATHFYLNSGQATKPDWYTQGEIEESFGPFRVAYDTKEFKAGDEIDLEIIVSPAPK